MNKPRIVIADDHQILADGLRSLLEPDFEVVAVVADGPELVAAARHYRPDVIIADISMPTLNGIDAADQLRQEGLGAKVVFLTMHREVAYARRALEAGASGFVLKHSVAAELVTAVHEALRGHVHVSPMIASEILHSYSGAERGPHRAGRPLTDRQQDVLRLIAQGRSAKEIAAELNISVRTAEAHKARIQEALGLQTTAELVKYAIRAGITSI